MFGWDSENSKYYICVNAVRDENSAIDSEWRAASNDRPGGVSDDEIIDIFAVNVDTPNGTFVNAKLIPWLALQGASYELTFSRLPLYDTGDGLIYGPFAMACNQADSVAYITSQNNINIKLTVDEENEIGLNCSYNEHIGLSPDAYDYTIIASVNGLGLGEEGNAYILNTLGVPLSMLDYV